MSDLTDHYIEHASKELYEVKRERDTLIACLRECVVALGVARDKYCRTFADNVDSIKTMPTPFDATLTHAKSTLSKYERCGESG